MIFVGKAKVIRADKPMTKVLCEKKNFMGHAKRSDIKKHGK